MFRKYDLKDYNFRLLLWLIALAATGVFFVGSAMRSLMMRQFLGVLLGVAVMLTISMMDYSWVLGFHWLIYLANLVLLSLVYIVGHDANGATRWIEFGSFRFQPVELSKILLVLFFAKYFMDHENDLSRPSTILRSILLIALPLILVFRQPDLKNTITLLVLFSVMYFAAGISYKVVALVLLITIPLLVGGLTLVIRGDLDILSDYQRGRIMMFLDPDNEEYSDRTAQQRNSVIAIGSGELTGKGWNNSSVGSVNKGNFIPETETDFIFAVIGEELGFLGSVGVILLLLLVVFECLMISRKAKDLAGRVLCCGVACIVSVQSFFNIGVACGMLPNTGTPLPFISYGLTSLVSLFIGMGFVLNVGLQGRITVPGRRFA